MVTITTTREDHLVAWLTALAISVHVMESALPTPLPGVKPGLANVVTVVALMTFGWRIATWIAVLRVIVGSMIIGTFLSPAFVLSFAGAIASVIVLGLAAASRIRFGCVGYSVMAAMAHMAAQVTVAYWFFVPHPALFNLLPVFMTMALMFGLATGFVGQAVINKRELGNP